MWEDQPQIWVMLSHRLASGDERIKHNHSMLSTYFLAEQNVTSCLKVPAFMTPHRDRLYLQTVTLNKRFHL